MHGYACMQENNRTNTVRLFCGRYCASEAGFHGKAHARIGERDRLRRMDWTFKCAASECVGAGG
eukprot:6176953-Pleurochrysis_carterae.AAC.3